MRGQSRVQEISENLPQNHGVGFYQKSPPSKKPKSNLPLEWSEQKVMGWVGKNLTNTCPIDGPLFIVKEVKTKLTIHDIEYFFARYSRPSSP